MRYPFAFSSWRRGVVMVVASALLSSCYVVPIQGPDGAVRYQTLPLPPPGTVMPLPGQAGAPGGPSPMANLAVRLYPANDLATQTGVINGAVTNMMTGKGRFNLTYRGSVLTGEATRVSNDDKRGVASAFGPAGLYMSCEYQMNTPFQGAGSCTFSDGAHYQMHVGN